MGVSASVLVPVLLLVRLLLSTSHELVQGWGRCVTLTDRFEASHAYDMTWEDVGRIELVVMQAKEEEKGGTKKKKELSTKQEEAECRLQSQSPSRPRISIDSSLASGNQESCTPLPGRRDYCTRWETWSEEKKTGVGRGGLADRSGQAACWWRRKSSG